MPNALTLTLLIPLLGTLAVAFIPGNYRFLIRFVALVCTGLSLLFGLVVFFGFEAGRVGYQMVQTVPWVDALGDSI